MRKFTCGVLTAALCLGCILLFSCTEEETPVEDNTGSITAFLGEWECEDNPLNDPDNYTGYLKLRVDKDGSFMIYDTEAGNPGIEGRLSVISDSRLLLRCSGDENFEPPPTWSEMTRKQMISYTLKSEEKLYLTFKDDKSRYTSTLIFDKVKK